MADAPGGLRSLLIEADSFISHMEHRGSWPGESYEVGNLIGRLRSAAEQLARAESLAIASEVDAERERLSADSIAELVAIAETMKARVALLLAYYLDSADPAVAEAFIHAFPRKELVE